MKWLLAFSLLTLTACTSKKEALPKEAVREQIKMAMPKIRKCYRAQLAKDPELVGKLVLQWEILPNGKVGYTQVVESLNEELDQCIATRISELIFDKPPKGVMPVVEYPFEFNNK